MAYKIIISPRAQLEIEDAIDYYAIRSSDAPVDFISSLNEAYTILSINPHFRICYKNVRTIMINVFPYSIFYTINEKEHTIRLLSCFHSKLNPQRRPKK
jgi:toxin ParE1/3/4